jgi:hypothetical protein
MKSNTSGLCKALLAVVMALVLAPVGASGAESAAVAAATVISPPGGNCRAVGQVEDSPWRETHRARR